MDLFPISSCASREREAEEDWGLSRLADFFDNRLLIFERTPTLKIPAIYQLSEMAKEGGLIGYGHSITQLYRDVMARQLVELLRGTKPAGLQVEQPTKFAMTVNLKIAKEIGINLPTSVLLRADEVIE